MKFFIFAITVAVSALCVAAQQPAASGSYTTYIGEQAFGTESYTLTANADGSAQSEADVSFGPLKYHAVTKAAANKPTRFELAIVGAPPLAVDFADGNVTVKLEGRPDRQVKATPTVLLENGNWHQLIFLMAQYDFARRGQQSFSAFIPSQALPFTLSLELVDSPKFSVAGAQVATDHFKANTDLGLGLEIWTDAAHVPLLITVPMQKLKIVRKGSEALAAVIAPAPAQPATAANSAFSSEEVTFANDAQKLVGTLTIPKTGTAPFPAVVIISGSGPQDRDGSTILNIYRLIAERLSANGVAVLRVDDRGAGKSSMPAKATSYRDLINDSRAAFEFLTHRSEIDAKRIALAGHSEGAETALTIAAEDPRVAAVMLLAGCSRSVDRVLLEQMLHGLALNGPVNPSDKSRYPAVVTRLDQMFREAKTNPKPANPDNDQLSWFREHSESDPLALARRVRVPVLILNGERDDNVLPYHALELGQALSASGNKQVLLRIFPNLTHVFTPSKLDKAVTDAQAAEVSNDFLDLLQRWATNVLVRGKDGGSIP